MATGHERLDARSLALHRAVAEKLRARPELLDIAHDNLNRWYETAGRSRPYLDAWRDILQRPVGEVLAVLESEGTGMDCERLTALRQASPFAGVLEPKERWAIYSAFEKGSK